MRKIYQSTFYDPEEGTRGDCFRACVASLLNKSKITDVPEFPLDHSQFPSLVVYLQKYGGVYVFNGMIYVNGKDPREIREKSLLVQLRDEEGVDGCFMVYGKSPRGIRHMVIYDKKGLVHDPHPSRDGVIAEGAVLIEKKIIGGDLGTNGHDIFSHSAEN